MAVSKLNPSAGGIPYGNNAGRPANPGIGRLYSNGEEKRLELYTAQGWQNIVSETPGVVSVSGVYLESTGSATVEITGTNFTTGATVSVIGTNGVEINADSTLVNSIVSISALLSGLSVAYEPYDIKVTNTSNLFGLLPDALYINDTPIWVTPAGSLGTFNINSPVSLQLSVTDDESNPITYSVTSGSLPSGLSLSSTGLISGTNNALTGTYSFTVSASDGSNAAQLRSFSIQSVAPVVSGGRLSSDATYYYRTFVSSDNLTVSNATANMDILVIAGGSAGGAGEGSNAMGGGGGGGGAGGVLSFTNITIPVGSNVAVVGGGGAGVSSPNASSTTRGGTGTYSQVNSLQMVYPGGPGAGEESSPQITGNYGSAGGAGGDTGVISTTYTVAQGNNGGGSSGRCGGGGGGAGAVGGTATGTNGGNGGAGTNSYSSWISAINSQMSDISGWSTATSDGRIAGGGGGGSGSGNTNASGAIGGAGGGGAGSLSPGSASSNGSFSGGSGQINTGSGGGAHSSGNAAGGSSGSGGSGLIIFRYLKSAVGG